MNENLLLTQIKQAQQDFTASALAMQDAIANFHFKRGYLAALQSSLQLAEHKLDKHIESDN